MKSILRQLLFLGVTTASCFAQDYTVLYSFNSNPHVLDGTSPVAGLVSDSAGNLYGTTFWGGADLLGTVFKLDPANNETILHSFTGVTGRLEPSAGLIRDTQGNLYGTTFAGGVSGCGIGCGLIFELNPQGKETVLYSFTGGADGAAPLAGLVRDEAGNFYGTTSQGGRSGCSSSVSHGCGTVFRLDARGRLTVLHTFTGNADGGVPRAGLVLKENGTLYGTASIGGSFSSTVCSNLGGCGTAFKLARRESSPSSTLSPAHLPKVKLPWLD